MELMGVGYLRAKLDSVRHRVLTRYAYYEMKDNHRSPDTVINAAIASRYPQTLGWCTKAVDQLADRLRVNGMNNDWFDMMGIYNVNNKDILFPSSFRGALISACDFFYVIPNDEGLPKIQVIDGANATGIIDVTTQLLTEGYAVLERDPRNDKPVIEAYFTPEKTMYIYNGKDIENVPNPVGYPLLVPIIYRPDARRPFGHSRISRACMSLQDSAKDVLVRAGISADFYSIPQKYVLGMDSEAERLDNWRATISSMLRFDRDEDGNVPTLGQFQQQSMAPHIDHFKMYANVFAGETGLTLDDLGFVSENPSSAEAIRAGHEALRVTASEAQRSFGVGIINAGFVAACLRDGIRYERSAIYDTSVKWAPIVEPDAAMLSSIGDGAMKINQAFPDYFTADTLEALTGIKKG